MRPLTVLAIASAVVALSCQVCRLRTNSRPGGFLTAADARETGDCCHFVPDPRGGWKEQPAPCIPADPAVLSALQQPIPPDSSLAAAAPGDYDWHVDAGLVEVARYPWRDDGLPSARYKDIMVRAQDGTRWGERPSDARSFVEYADGRIVEEAVTFDDPLTGAHETAHVIDAQLRNASHFSPHYYYVGDGIAQYAVEPGTPVTAVRDRVPAFGRNESYYTTYFENPIRIGGASTSTESILHLFEEWNAYVLESEVAAELAMAGRPFARDTRDGAVALLLYCSVAAATLGELEPGYLNHHRLFKSVYARLAEQTMALARSAPLSERAAGILAKMQTAPETETTRTALRIWLGPAFATRVLGF
jgi:hypothetical protein